MLFCRDLVESLLLKIAWRMLPFRSLTLPVRENLKPLAEFEKRLNISAE